MTRTRLSVFVAGIGIVVAANQTWLTREYGFDGYLALVALAFVALAATAVGTRRR